MFQGDGGVQFAVVIRHFEILWGESTVQLAGRAPSGSGVAAFIRHNNL